MSDDRFTKADLYAARNNQSDWVPTMSEAEVAAWVEMARQGSLARSLALGLPEWNRALAAGVVAAKRLGVRR